MGLKRTPIPKRRAKPRRGPLRSPKYRKWLTHERCAVAQSILSGRLCDVGFSDPAHTQNNGMRSKGPDSSCGPLCHLHHLLYDKNRGVFEEVFGLDMKAIAAEHYARYLAETGATK
jgi:hypothetical protein